MSTKAEHPTEPRRLRGVELRSLLLVRYGFACCWCGGALEATDADYSTEHLIPKVRGGPEMLLENLAPSHRTCNEERGYLPISDWLLVCAHRGWRPNRPVIAAALDELSRIAGSLAARAYAIRELAAMDQDVRKKAA